MVIEEVYSMARVYYSSTIIVNQDINIFNDMVGHKISEWQSEGYFVEVQFSANNNQVVALLLKYKEV